jgi:serine/threonine protein kinase
MDHAETEEERHTKKYGRHGDINPNNILWFDGEPGDNENLTGTLKLADFGQAELNTLLSRTWTGTVANTLTYRPPECDMEGKDIRQSFDIWCLGCVLLEFVAWILGGGQLVTKFGQSRCAPDFFRADEKADTFFQFSVNLSTQVTEVVVKESVTNVSESMKLLNEFAKKLR